jgi:hypothetical protein
MSPRQFAAIHISKLIAYLPDRFRQHWPRISRCAGFGSSFQPEPEIPEA